MYYITVLNEKYRMPNMPDGAEDGIIKGMYSFRRSEQTGREKVHLLGSGAILNEVIKAADMLEE